MKRGIKVFLMAFIAVLLLVAGYFVGYKQGCDSIKSAGRTIDQQTFYAEIQERADHRFLVRGLSVNDINYRGEFSFSVTEGTVLLWRGTAVALSDLGIGDTIAVTFHGEILESYPAQIQEVVKIQLLEDER